MAKFIHTVDDIIIVDGSSYPLAFFLTQEGAYVIPSGATSQYYDDSIPKRIASDGTNQLLSSDVVWATGDSYIANKAIYDAAYTDYVYYPDLATAKISKRNEIADFAQTIRDGNISYGGNIYSSPRASDAHRYYFRYDRTPTIPGTFYLRTIADVEVVLTLADLKSMADLIDDLHRDVEENMHDHWDAVDALGTINDVKTYDFSGGWPTIPYV